MTWPIKKLGDKEYFEILESGVEKFEGKKEYLSTSSIEKNKIITSEGKITYQKRPSRANMQPRLNSVWFARMINTIKVYSFTERNKDEVNKYILSTGFAGILCNTEKVHPLYLEKIFLSDWFNNLKNNLASDKAIQKSLNNEDIKILEIPLPPLPIQQKIVKVLDAIQSAIEIQEKIIEKTKELKKSLMNLLFHYGLAGLRVKELMSSRVGELKSEELEKLGLKLKKTEIGEIPEHWEVVRLGEICEIVYGIQTSVSEVKEKIGRIPILTNKNITDEGSIELSELSYYPEDLINTQKHLLKKGDIIFNWRSGSLEHVGKSAIFNLDGKFTFSSFLLRFRVKQDKAYPHFLNYYLNKIRKEGFLKFFAHQASINQSLNASISSSIPVFLPPLPEQQKIAEILQTIDQKIEIEKRKKELYEELFKTMLNKIMSQEIDVEKIEI